jgi:methoxymalonate biosynthesis acyl carrier protein
MTDVEALRDLTLLFLEELNMSMPAADVDLMGTGLIDSLAFVTLLLGLERRFGISIDVNELDLDDFRTTTSIVAYVTRNRAHLTEGARNEGPRRSELEPAGEAEHG